jgi:hypothetical protein
MTLPVTASAIQPQSGNALLNFTITGPWASLIPAGQTQLPNIVQLEILESMLPIFESSQNVPANVVFVQQIIAAIKLVNGQL